MEKINLILNKVRNFETLLNSFFINRQKEIEAILISAIAQEPLLLVGPPGTAKSQLITKFRTLLGVSDADYFEYMLTKFTEPSEIIGPLDLKRMKLGEFFRKTSGKLPEAKVAFLDEIFKSNSAILNTLLTILNERKFYQDGLPVNVPLKILLAATNEIPTITDLDALKDRFILKVPVKPLEDIFWDDLIKAGFKVELKQDLNLSTGLTLEEFEELNSYFLKTIASFLDRGEDNFFDKSLYLEFKSIIKSIILDYNIQISDRKLIKLYKLIRARALLRRGGAVEREDLHILAYIGNSIEELEFLADKIPLLVD